MLTQSLASSRANTAAAAAAASRSRWRQVAAASARGPALAASGGNHGLDYDVFRPPYGTEPFYHPGPYNEQSYVDEHDMYGGDLYSEPGENDGDLYIESVRENSYPVQNGECLES